MKNGAASMALMKKGEFWYGTTSGDTQAELRRYSVANRHEAVRFAAFKCDCGCRTFALQTDEEAGVAIRTCTDCGQEHLMGDSADYVEKAAPEAHECVCENEVFELMSGVSVYKATHDVRWYYIACHCVDAIWSRSLQTGSVKLVMLRASSPRYERPNPAEFRLAGSGPRKAQSQGSSFKPWLEQYLTPSRWRTKPRHVDGAMIALTARATEGCHEVVGRLDLRRSQDHMGHNLRSVWSQKLLLVGRKQHWIVLVWATGFGRSAQFCPVFIEHLQNSWATGLTGTAVAPVLSCPPN